MLSMKYINGYFYFSWLVASIMCFWSAGAKETVDTSKTPRMTDIIQYYSDGMGIIMRFKKTTRLKLLTKTRISTGQIFLSKKAMALKLEDKLNTRMVLNNHTIWYIMCLSGKPQVTQWSFKDDKSAVLILALFQKNRFSEVFRFVSSHPKGRTYIRQFKPIGNAEDIQSLSVKTEGYMILTASIEWKNGNSEQYQFSDIRRNQNISDKHFQINDKKLTCF